MKFQKNQNLKLSSTGEERAEPQFLRSYGYNVLDFDAQKEHCQNLKNWNRQKSVIEKDYKYYYLASSDILCTREPADMNDRMEALKVNVPTRERMAPAIDLVNKINPEVHAFIMDQIYNTLEHPRLTKESSSIVATIINKLSKQNDICTARKKRKPSKAATLRMEMLYNLSEKRRLEGKERRKEITAKINANKFLSQSQLKILKKCPRKDAVIIDEGEKQKIYNEIRSAIGSLGYENALRTNLHDEGPISCEPRDYDEKPIKMDPADTPNNNDNLQCIVSALQDYIEIVLHDAVTKESANTSPSASRDRGQVFVSAQTEVDNHSNYSPEKNQTFKNETHGLESLREKRQTSPKMARENEAKGDITHRSDSGDVAEETKTQDELKPKGDKGGKGSQGGGEETFNKDRIESGDTEENIIVQGQSKRIDEIALKQRLAAERERFEGEFSRTSSTNYSSVVRRNDRNNDKSNIEGACNRHTQLYSLSRQKRKEERMANREQIGQVTEKVEHTLLRVITSSTSGFSSRSFSVCSSHA